MFEIKSLKDAIVLCEVLKTYSNKWYGLIFWEIFINIITHTIFNDTNYNPYYNLVIALIVLIIWFLITVRIYFRDKILTPLLIGILCVIIYAIWLNVELDVKYKSGLIIAVSILYLIIWIILRNRVYPWKDVLIFIYISTDNDSINNSVKTAIEDASKKIENENKNIKIVIPPVNLYKRTNDCERHMRWCTAADAIISVSVISDTSTGSNNNYKFTSFASRVNRYIWGEVSKDYAKEQVYRTWNTNEGNELSKKDTISKNWEQILKIHVCSLFLLKEDYTSAYPIAISMYDNEDSQDKRIKTIETKILGQAAILSSQYEENIQHNYQMAFSHLSALKRRYPAIDTVVPNYYQSLARLYYFFGDLKNSKKYTRLLRDVFKDQLGYETNMGFYALIEGNYETLVSKYKKITKLHPNSNYAKGVIAFFEYERKRLNENPQLIEKINLVIAFWKFYIKPKKSRREWNRYYSHLDDASKKTFKEINEIINRH